MKFTENSIAQNNENGKPENAFEVAKRAFETAYASGNDYSVEIQRLATAIAKSVLNKVIDPQRKAAGEKATVSNSGINKTLDELKRGIYFDNQNLDNIRYWSNQPYEVEYTKDGDVRNSPNKAAETAFDTLLDYTLTDGIDLVNAAIVALLELATEHAANGAGWLDSVYTVRRLSKKVYICETDSRAYKDVETTPMQEVYRAVRRVVANSRAVQTDPRSAYTYISIDAYEPEELEQIFVRCGKYADVGGTDCHGLYTGDIESFRAQVNAEALIERMNLTARELQILKLRMRGYGGRTISNSLNISRGSYDRSLQNIRRKAREIGFDI